MSTDQAPLTRHPLISLPAPAAVQSDGPHGFTLKDCHASWTPPAEAVEMVSLLEELGQLCLLVSKRRISNCSTPLHHPHLEDYRSWLIAQARSVVVSLASRYDSLDNEVIGARIKAVVAHLAQTRAAPAARVAYQICNDMKDLYLGHDPRSMLSKVAVEDQQATSAILDLKTLDFCGDPDQQSSKSHQCDLIIVSSTVRTKETSHILHRLRRSLRADGQLIFQETDPLDWITYVFGLRPEWWSRDHDERWGTPASNGLDGRTVAAVGMGRAPGHAVDNDFRDHLTVFLVVSESCPQRLTSSQTVAPSISVLVESIIRHLREDGYRVTRCASEGQTPLDQEVISVESVDHGCATVAVACKQPSARVAR
ncbi:polyketide synthase [Teratosphaeria destructans]|uniref:Polyketide synthase n=1 Tax=Teratosphaeria destructans TaxID=418781 RepID=A0A9W7T1E8_9PEZI|nr:polyketide synthase [Teratosphaeria destructans]